MNDETPYTAIGDEPVEARIVAWVLGEASAFEAAELERLCEERPELLVFKRRMQALHGLLTEAENAKPDDAWKLPPEKRRALDGIFGGEEPIRLENAKEKRIRHSGRRAILAIAACLILTIVIAALIAPMTIRQRKKAESPTITSYASQAPESAANPADRERQLQALNKAVRDQEDKVEERRKALATMVRTKGVIYKGDDPFYGQDESAEAMRDESHEESIKRGLDAQDYADAKREFEADQELLQQMKLKQMGEKIASRAPSESVGVHEATPSQNFQGTPAKPSAPSSSIAKVITTNTGSPATVPVPDVDVTTPSMEFGASDDFGAGWGASDASGGFGGDAQVASNAPDAKPAPAKLPGQSRSSSIDSLADGVAPATGQSERVGGDVGSLSFAGKKELPARPEEGRDLVELFSKGVDGSVNAPTGGGVEYELHTGYASEYLFRGVDFADVAKEAQPQAGVPRMEPASLLHEIAGTIDPSKLEEAKRKHEADLESDPSNSLAKDALDRIAQVKERLDREKPKPNLADLTDEIPAAEDPYSTFSLNISDASFQIAQAALAKGERPDPAGIKVEQFYNAVDYGDPAPSAGEPVAVSIEQSAHPVIPGRNLVRVALKTAAAGRSASQPLRLTLLVDQSGSMVREDRRAAMDKALAGLAGLLTEKDLVSVVGFSRTPHLLADSMPGNQAGKLAAIVNQSASEGGTNLEEAIKLAEQMADRNTLVGAQNRIVLFTDGAANLGNADPARLAEKVKQLRQKGIAFDIAGIAADGLNDELLGELARNGNGRYYIVGKGADDNFAKQLAGAFRPAAENVKVQVRFNPERVGRYKLIGFEKDRLKTEDFRNDAVDAAELAAEEAGVAIYQVEPLPEGKGELGEVSVRFRDAASAQMVERTWTIPHDSGAPAIDRATPSMQLAVLSMLAGEKLKGGPLADAIDFKQLTEPGANVKEFYGNTGRVGEVLRMVDALK